VTNFILAQPSAPDTAASVADRLLERGLVVRSYPQGPLVDWLRITVRSAPENERLLEAIGERLDADRGLRVREP